MLEGQGVGVLHTSWYFLLLSCGAVVSCMAAGHRRRSITVKRASELNRRAGQNAKEMNSKKQSVAKK